jgi:hypothetical protein
LLDASLNCRCNFDPSVFVLHLVVAHELLCDKAALLVAEVVGDQECRLLFYVRDIVPPLESEVVAVNEGAHVRDLAHLDVSRPQTRHVCRRYIDRLTFNNLALLVEVKDIKTNLLNMMIIFSEIIGIRVTPTSDKWQEFAFLSIVNNILRLDVNILN